jgi:glycosyltransferase involved in cell wall biosynthesis
MYPVVNTVPSEVSKSSIIIVEHDFSDESIYKKKKLKKFIQDNNIGSIYLTDKPYFNLLYLLLRIWGVKRIVLHDHMPGERTKVPDYKAIIKKIIHTLGIFSCDYYIGVSRFVYNRFIDTCFIPARKCSYVLNGIKPIIPDAKNAHYANNVFNIPVGSKIIVSTGRSVFYKGIDFIIKCADTLINGMQRNDVFFLHLGDGPDLPIFKNMVYEYGLESKFVFGGKRDDISAILQSSHIAIHASHGEAFSLAILEYLSAGLATIVPDNSGNSEAVEHGINGFLYPTGDISSATKLLIMLIDDETLRLRISEAAKKSVDNKFTLERMNKDFKELVCRIL